MSMFDEEIYESLADLIAAHFFGHFAKYSKCLIGKLYQVRGEERSKKTVNNLREYRGPYLKCAPAVVHGVGNRLEFDINNGLKA